MWKDVPAFSGRYEASENGEIRNAKTKSIRKGRLNRGGYLQINIPKNDGSGKSVTKVVHRLVAEAFIPNPDNLPEVNHKDGNKLNNSVDNLEWCSYSENTKHAHKTGLAWVYHGEDHIRAKLTRLDVELIKQLYSDGGISQDKIAKQFGVSQTTIGRIIRGERYAVSQKII